jgi:hypothetical protein
VELFLTNKEIIIKLKQLQKDRPNVGADLTLYALINLLIAYFKGVEEKPDLSIKMDAQHPMSFHSYETK